MLSLDTRPLHYHVLAAETRRWSPAHTPNCERTIVTHFLLHQQRSCPIILYLPNRSVVRLHFFITPEGKTTTPYFRGVYLFSAWHGAPKSVRCPAREDVEDTRGTARNWNTGNKLRAMAEGPGIVLRVPTGDPAARTRRARHRLGDNAAPAQS